MSLSRSDRFQLKDRIVKLVDHDASWDENRVDLLLAEFGLGPIYDNYNSPSFAQIIALISDEDLIEMHRIVIGEEALASSVRDEHAENWKLGLVRMFISHSVRHKEEATAIAAELELSGIHGFVAHESMAETKPWLDQIDRALRTADVFVALVHPEFNESAWCQQETGLAMGLGKPIYAIRMGVDPVGFLGRDQWPSGFERRPTDVADLIVKWTSSLPTLADLMVPAVLTALRGAQSYIDAGQIAKRVAQLHSLTEEQWADLDDICRTNDQVRNAGGAWRELRPFYAKHGRQSAL